MAAADINPTGKKPKDRTLFHFLIRGFNTVEGDPFVGNMLNAEGLPETIIVINHNKFIAKPAIGDEISSGNQPNRHAK